MLNKALVDSNIILDILTDDKNWSDWSIKKLEQLSVSKILCINPIIYSEISIGFKEIEMLDYFIEQFQFAYLELPQSALFLAGKAFLNYRKKNEVTKSSTLPDFFIGAHASVLGAPLITRDPKRMRYYFPKCEIISPD